MKAPEESEVDKAVSDWYGAAEHWLLSKKTSKCVDYQLLNREKMVQGKDVLNIGCFYPQDEMAFGRFARRWVAIDFIPEVIERCRQVQPMSDTVEFMTMDARELQFPNESFDTVIDFSSGDQMTALSYEKVLNEVYRVLKSKGVFIVTYVNAGYMSGIDGYVMGKECGYTRVDKPSEMKEMLERAGFTIVEEKSPMDPRIGMVVVKP